MNQCLLSWSRVCYINLFFLYSEFIQDTMWDIFHFFSWYQSGQWKVGRFSVLVFIAYQIGSSTAPLLALAADPLNMTTYTSSSSPRMDSSVLNVTYLHHSHFSLQIVFLRWHNKVGFCKLFVRIHSLIASVDDFMSSFACDWYICKSDF